MGTLFGTDGVRGIANEHPITVEMALAIGRATAHVLRKNHSGFNRILVGKDTRLSGYMLENALTAGICSMGVDALLTGPLPTPGIAFLTRTMRCVGGIVISASHNPYEDNGIKIFGSSGYKLNNDLEEEIERLLQSSELINVRPSSDEIGRAMRIDDASGRYIEFCKSTFPTEYTLTGMRIVLDCANGAAYRVAPTIFTELGAHVTTLHAKPNGLNINAKCGSQYTEDIRRTVIETKSDIGLAFDGDADRLIAVDETGCEISGDHIIAICAKQLKNAKQLCNNIVVLTPMSNSGLRLALDEMDIQWIDAGVGDRLVLELMKKEGACIGGEQSGHVIFLDKHTTGDGIVTALQLLSVMKCTQQKLSALSEIFTISPQTLVNVEVRSKPPMETMPGVLKAIEKVEQELRGKGRILVRYSGTQPMCRVMVEASNQDTADRLAESVAIQLRKIIGTGAR